MHNRENVYFEQLKFYTEFVIPPNPTQQFFSGHLSSAQRLRLQNSLICEGTSGRIFEINRNGEYTWEWITPFVNGNSKGVLFTWIYRAERYELDYPAFDDKDLDPRPLK